MLLYKSEKEFPDNVLMPFLYVPTKGAEGLGSPQKIGHAIVVIGFWDLAIQTDVWEDFVGHYPLAPEVDVIAEAHQFETELEALQFMKEWWSKAKI